MKPLAITLGDPAGIGAEVVGDALRTLSVPAWVFGSQAWAGSIAGAARFVDVGGSGGLDYGRVDARAGRVALDSIEAAIDAIERGDCSALVTAPIHKQSIALAGSPYPGHTEILAARAGLKRYGHDFAMYFDSPRLRTVLLTVHLSLREAIDAIDAEGIAALARLTAREYERLEGAAPRIAVAGLNPHAGEGGRFGSEEEAIAEGVRRARDGGIDISGPHAPGLSDGNARQVRCRHGDVSRPGAHRRQDSRIRGVGERDARAALSAGVGRPWNRVRHRGAGDRRRCPDALRDRMGRPAGFEGFAMNKWTFRIIGLLLLLMFTLVFVQLYKQLVTLQRQQAPATSPR
jgi:hypothetical protein